MVVVFMVRCDSVFKGTIGLRKIVQFITIIFLVIFVGLVFTGGPMDIIGGQYVENYLSIYTNAHVLLSRSEIPMYILFLIPFF